MASFTNPQQRAFVCKKNRATAADVRMHVRSGGLVHPCQMNSLEVDGTGTAQLLLAEVVDAVDVEEQLSQRKTSTVYDFTPSTNSSLTPRALYEFPADDVEVRQVEREWGTAEPPVDLRSVPVSAHAHSILSSLSEPLSLVHRKLGHLSNGDALLRLLRERSTITSNHLYEGDREGKPARITRSASLAERDRQIEASKRTSYTSCASTGTAGSSEMHDGRLQLSLPDHALPGVVDRVSVPKMDEENEVRRATGRHPATIGLLYPKTESELMEVRVQPPYPEERSGYRLFIKVIKLGGDQQTEPLFGSLTLYDIRQRRRISESFHFDVNSESLRAMIPRRSSLSDVLSRCQQAAFALSSPLSDVTILVKLEKVLSGCDPGEAFDVLQSSGRDERNREKAATAAVQYCARLGSYRMPLAVMVVDLQRMILGGGGGLERSESGMGMVASILSSDGAPLAADDTSSIVSADRVSVSTTSTFKRIGSGTSASTMLKVRTPLSKRKTSGTMGEESSEAIALRAHPSVSLSAMQPLTLTLNNFVKYESDRMSDEEVIKTALEQRRNPARGRTKAFPVEITLRIWGENADEVEGQRVNAEGRIVGGNGEGEGTPSPNGDDEKVNTQEVDEMPQQGIYQVNLAYRNTLLLYPRSVNMSTRSGTARNICVKIQLMDSKERPQKVFFDRETRMPTADCTFTSVLYHDKSPVVSDEMKMSLPASLDDGHHLLFSFFHISCKTTQRDEPIEFPLGYTWLPLLRNNRLVSGDFALPIAVEKLPQSYGYLWPDEAALPNSKWLDGHRPAFSISLSPISSVHPQDEFVEGFLSSFASLCSSKPSSESALLNSIHGICKARPEPMIAFLYQILDALLVLIANPPYSRAVSSACFSTLGQLAKICTRLVDSGGDAHGRGLILPTYVHYFKMASKESRPRSTACRELAKESVHLASPDSEKIFDIIEDMERSRNVKETVESVTPNTNKLLHEELAELWTSSSGASREMAFLNSFFFLELIAKSMAEFLSMTGRLFLPRKSRFSDRFLKSLAALSEIMTQEVISRCLPDLRLASSLCSSWAFFLRDSLSLLDRSFALRLVSHFNRELINKINSSSESLSTSLVLLKLNLLRIVCSHEHFIVLNLPHAVNGQGGGSTQTPSPGSMSSPAHSSSSSLQPPPSPGGSSLGSRDSSAGSLSAELSSEYRSRHFLLGLILSDLACILESSPSPIVRSRVLSLICSLLAAHEADTRMTDVSMRNKVACLYTPLLGIVLDSASLLFDASDGGRHSTSTPSSSRLSAHRHRHDSDNRSSRSGVDLHVALAIAGMGDDQLMGGESMTSPNSIQRPQLNVEQTRQLLVSLVWVLRNLDRSGLRAWMREQSPSRLVALLDVVALAVSSFEYKTHSRDEILEGVTEARDLDETIIPEGGTLNRKREGVRWRENILNVSAGEDSSSLHLESLVCAEVTLTVMDTLETASQVVSSPGSDHLLFLLPLLFRLLMHILSCRQSVSVLECVFASQRTFVVKYPDVVFEQESDQCGELCLQLLRHCASLLAGVRSHAAASAYLLMRQSYESTSSLARVKMHFTMSLSTLVSNGTRSGTWLNEDCLRRSLRTLLNYAHNESSSALNTSLQSFCEQVKDLVFNMHMILSDTVRMKEYANDFEMSMDLIHRVAKGYQNNPDLRVTWLLNMASRAAERECFAEAAQCTIHASALVAEYLAMLPCSGHLPHGAAAFSSLSENILEESAVSDDVISPDAEGICESRHFSETGLVHLCEKAFLLLERAQQYEMMPVLFQIVEPILSSNRDFRRLSSLHLRLGEALSRIEIQLRIKEDIADAWLSPLRSADRRCFGTYFRVAFFGSRFGDIDGEEFVYKESPFTKLSEISSRLESFYAERFGKNVVEVIKDSNTVSRDSLDSSRAFLQITYVEPYLDVWERKRRTTYFERSHRLTRFAYATPFTRDGKAHGELKEQYKRRTILTIHNSFPYVKTRIRVVDREQKVLSPIEVAIEDVEKKTRELAAAVAQQPPDAKMLQMVLQGCIGTTVNQGPIEVANVFLSSVPTDERGKPVNKLQNKLRLAFRDFSKKCADALVLNKQLIQVDQLAYQNELHKNYVEFTKKMAPMMAKGTVRPPSALLRSTPVTVI